MRNTFEAKGNTQSITNDDTRDVSILIVRRLMDLGYIEDNDDYYFDIQDTIQDEINDLLNINEHNQKITFKTI